MSLFPVASEQPTMRPAIANLTIIGLNVFMFLLEFILGDSFIEAWAFTPAQLTAFLHGSGSFQSVLTIFTSMFMHAGWSHLFGNMLFLWIFGQATESAFGSRMYTVFYLICGVVANMAQYLVDPNSTVLNLGASRRVALMRYIEVLEEKLQKRATLNLMPMQPGDVTDTDADVSETRAVLGYEPKVSVEEGVARFVDWYREYYGV